MTDFERYYRSLGIKPPCSDRQLKAAFRRKAFLHHPDRNGNTPESTEKFKEIVVAFEELSSSRSQESFSQRGKEKPERKPATEATQGGAKRRAKVRTPYEWEDWYAKIAEERQSQKTLRYHATAWGSVLAYITAQLIAFYIRHENVGALISSGLMSIVVTFFTFKVTFATIFLFKPTLQNLAEHIDCETAANLLVPALAAITIVGLGFFCFVDSAVFVDRGTMSAAIAAGFGSYLLTLTTRHMTNEFGQSLGILFGILVGVPLAAIFGMIAVGTSYSRLRYGITLSAIDPYLTIIQSIIGSILGIVVTQIAIVFFSHIPVTHRKNG